MRKLICALFISLDGVAEEPSDWAFDSVDEGVMADMGEQLAAQDTVLLGRVTYQYWVDYWPTVNDDPFANYINNTPKYVFSKTLDSVKWQNSTLIKGDLVEEVNRLKQQPGKNIGTAGSPGLVLSLLENDLVDELRLVTFPVIAGKGKRLFNHDIALKRLKLVEAKTSASGMVTLVYAPR